jgi:dihydrofolate reductase
MRMSKLRVSAFTISLDGYGAGPSQSLESPMGEGTRPLHQWMVGTKTFYERVVGSPEAAEGGRRGMDDDFAARSFEDVGAWIMGRNMFGPVRGAWPDESWQGWWGQNPPYHVPVFVLTHHARAPLHLEGGTTFYFVTEGIHAALQRAKEAAKDRDVRIGGGVSTVRQYLAEGLIDELHLVVSPLLIGRGEHLLHGIDTVRLGYSCAEHARSDLATHVVLKK